MLSSVGIEGQRVYLGRHALELVQRPARLEIPQMYGQCRICRREPLAATVEGDGSRIHHVGQEWLNVVVRIDLEDCYWYLLPT